MKEFVEKIRQIGIFCIKWRYVIALILFIFCVAFKLHGSSIAEYNNLFTNAESYNSEEIVAGESRSVRSDEWAVHTPYYMSQTYNNYEKDSNMMSLEGQDMIVGYNAPVLDITIIAKPLTWGYILLGNEYGLSWYWCMKLILLFLVSFELCMIVTQKNKKVSLLGAIMIALSPVVQWWFVPHIVDPMLWGMVILVLAYHFFTAQKKWLKNLTTILLPLAVIVFALALFPSVQIPVALVVIALLVAFLVRDKKMIRRRKSDVWRILGMAVFAIGVLGYTIVTSWSAISALMNTAYPGERVSLGGDYEIADLFTDLTSFTLPFKDITYGNNSEVSTFIHFAPLFLLLFPIICRKRKRDRNMIVGKVLVGCLLIMIAFMLVGFPELLAKLTFFSYINRMKLTYGLVAVIFTVWGIDMIWRKRILTSRQIFAALAIYGFLNICFIGEQELSYLKWWQYGVIIVGVVGLAYLMLKKHQKLFLAGMTAVMIIAGATVNPIAQGVSALTDHPLEQKIREIAEEDSEAYWLALDSLELQSIGVANGAKTLNAVNFYPDVEKWELIDPDGEYEEIWNRYAHIIVRLTDEETEIKVGDNPDVIEARLSCKNIEKWGVKYLVSPSELEYCQADFEKIYTDTEGDHYIYQRSENE